MWQELVENFDSAAWCDEKRSAGRLNETLRRFKQRVARIAQVFKLLTVNRNEKSDTIERAECGIHGDYTSLLVIWRCNNLRAVAETGE
jgi:hypothetical protein